ncbi:FGGY family carbohydrate kinase, partial [Clostridium sp. IBUN13A]
MSLEINDIRNSIINGKTALGIEFGSTRIKSVLINENNEPIASGSHDWENRYINNIWTYTLDDIWTGLQNSYKNMADEVNEKYGVVIEKIGAIGISAMMHGYMVFNKENELLVPFRTWRNTITEKASEELTRIFN